MANMFRTLIVVILFSVELITAYIIIESETPDELMYQCSRDCLDNIGTDDPSWSVQCRRGCYSVIASNKHRNCNTVCGQSRPCGIGCTIANDYLTEMENSSEEDNEEPHRPIVFPVFEYPVVKDKPQQSGGADHRYGAIQPHKGQHVYVDRFQQFKAAVDANQPPPQGVGCWPNAANIPAGVAAVNPEAFKDRHMYDELVKKRSRRKIILVSLLCTLMGSALAAAILLTSVYRRRRKDLENAYSKLEEKMDGGDDNGNEYETNEHC